MELINITHNDDLRSVANKCNINFKQIGTTLANLLKRQNMVERGVTNDTINQAVTTITNVTIPNEVTSQINALDIPDSISSEVTTQIAAADIPGQVADALDQALGVTMTSTLSDFFTEDECTVIACNAMKWGDMAFIRFSYKLNSTLAVPSDGDIADVTLGKLKVGWRPFDITNVILDQTMILIGDVDSSGDVKARSANSRGTSYTIDANAVLYASMMLMLGLQ